MTNYVLISTTLPSKDTATAVARRLVEEKLAACVQVSGPIHSTYRWEGRIEQGEEWLCTAKSLSSLFSRIERAIGDLHPYDVPEIIATPLVDVAASYAKWLEQQVKPDSLGS